MDGRAAADAVCNLDFIMIAAPVQSQAARQFGQEGRRRWKMAGWSKGAVMDHRRWCGNEMKELDGGGDEEDEALQTCGPALASFLRSEAA